MPLACWVVERHLRRKINLMYYDNRKIKAVHVLESVQYDTALESPSPVDYTV